VVAGVEGFEPDRFCGGRGTEDRGLASGPGTQVGPGTRRSIDLGQGEGDERRSFVLDARPTIGHGPDIAGHSGVHGHADR
jgi:hypothetical protein